ncbi:MAG: aminotransferase class I/II-fold pyridoxal phosphate-dependent enzyme, partial [Pirellulaceae bacterium]|nr:aminotransferase class I/II-fold pyridoxal phosphate-dependent enzyme [Pirellulaceae bacterium]
FYAFANIKDLGRTSSEIAQLLLDRAGVALLPGTAFGSQGEGFLRLCYANSIENLQNAIHRIRDVLSTLDSC